MTLSDPEMNTLKARAARYAIIGGVVVFGIKVVGYVLTGSVGILSDALESTVNVAAAAITAWAVSIAARPPDDSHPYGHDKVEYLSSVLEGLLIGMAAVLIIATARERFLDLKPITAPIPGMIVTALASILNLLLGRYLIATGRRVSSVALESDGQHVMADVITSAGVLIGVGLSVITSQWWIDPTIAILVALNVVWTAIMLMRRSIGGLMDAALSSAELETIHTVLNRFKDRYIEIHDLRTRTSGPRRFVDFHLILPGHTTVLDAHDLCDEIEAAIIAAISSASVTIHVEPTAFRIGSKSDVRF
jgi:cation diffusion facilitator family transporter